MARVVKTLREETNAALRWLVGPFGRSLRQRATVAPFPFIIWGADELRRRRRRHRTAQPATIDHGSLRDRPPNQLSDRRRGRAGPANLRRRLCLGWLSTDPASPTVPSGRPPSWRTQTFAPLTNPNYRHFFISQSLSPSSLLDASRSPIPASPPTQGIRLGLSALLFDSVGPRR